MNHAAFCLPPERDRVLILVNPKAGRRSVLAEVERLAELLGTRGFGVDVLDQLGEATERADRLHEERRLRALIGVGGDGTAAELVNRTQPGVPITLLPAGTANLLARQFGLSDRLEMLAETVAEGVCRRLDAGQAGGRIFLLMASCGFDAEVVRQVHALRHTAPGGGHISYRSYLKPILRSIRNYEYPQIRVYCDEAEVGAPAKPVVAPWVFVCNLPRYGWGLKLAPEADGTDGLLNLCAFGGRSLWHGLRYLAAVQLGGWHRRMSDCTVRRARRLRLESDRPVAYQLDGDPAGELPLEIDVLPGRMTLVAPS